MVYNKMPNKFSSCQSSQQYTQCFNQDNYDKKNSVVDEFSLAIAYVAWQEWRNVLCAEEGICQGTIFSDLIMPFYGADKSCYKRGCN